MITQDEEKRVAERDGDTGDDVIILWELILLFRSLQLRYISL
jgi:hypothetical protein